MSNLAMIQVACKLDNWIMHLLNYLLKCDVMVFKPPLEQVTELDFLILISLF